MSFYWTCSNWTCGSPFNYLDAGKVPVSVFLDLSKAFDTLNHTILIEKLQYYGLNDTSLNWFHSYLHDRLQFTEYNSVCSHVVTLSTGVPQGSILGPLLFIIYMNDIQAATSNFKAILYADDTNLVSPLCSFSSSNSMNSNNLSEVTAMCTGMAPYKQIISECQQN